MSKLTKKNTNPDSNTVSNVLCNTGIKDTVLAVFILQTSSPALIKSKTNAKWTCVPLMRPQTRQLTSYTQTFLPLWFTQISKNIATQRWRSIICSVQYLSPLSCFLIKTMGQKNKCNLFYLETDMFASVTKCWRSLRIDVRCVCRKNASTEQLLLFVSKFFQILKVNDYPFRIGFLLPSEVFTWIIFNGLVWKINANQIGIVCSLWIQLGTEAQRSNMC